MSQQRATTTFFDVVVQPNSAKFDWFFDCSLCVVYRSYIGMISSHSVAFKTILLVSTPVSASFVVNWEGSSSFQLQSLTPLKMYFILIPILVLGIVCLVHYMIWRNSD